MFKSSFLIVLIQITGIILGLLTIYFVAGDMAPEVYSLVGIYTIVSSVVLVFSNFAVETTMLREALYWKEQGDEEKVIEYTTQTIVSKFLGFIILTPLIVGYLVFICFSKYNGDYLVILICFYFGSCLNALCDSLSLIVRAQGGYVFSQFARTMNSDIMKFFAIIVYLKLGATPYLLFYSLCSLPLLFLFLHRLRKSISTKYFNIRGTISKIKEAKFLFLRSYLDFGKSYADSILVSILFSPAIMGSYTLLKNFENLIRNFEDGFFDVLSQNQVRYKGDKQALTSTEKKINYARVATLGLIIIGLVVFMQNPTFFINLVHLSQYESIVEIVYCVFGIAILYLLGKYETNTIALFGTSKINFYIGIVGCVVSIVSFGWILILHGIPGMIAQRITVYFSVSALCVYIFFRDRTKMYTSVLK